MRIVKSRRVIVLGRMDTKAWEDSGPRGSEFRVLVRRFAREMANEAKRPVEVYASARAGGWLADHVQPTERVS